MPWSLASPKALSAADVSPSEELCDRSRQDLRRFLILVVQLALLLGVFHAFRVEDGRNSSAEPATEHFIFFASIVFCSFAIHYWLPFRVKEFFWIAVSLLSMAFFFPARVIVGLLAFGVLFFLILSSQIAYRLRIAAVGACFMFAMLVSAYASRGLSGWIHIPSSFWPIFGSIFMFRLIVYAHDVRYMTARPSFREFLAYFFLLPNFYFLLFPVIDFKTMRLSYYRRNIHDIAQQGIIWIFRGTVQLILYRAVNTLWNLETLYRPKSLWSLLWIMLLTFMLYLNVSGVFHIVVGMLRLFGYDLPETNHKYMLSSSMIDFWRRINIYWKDFMVKIVYFPVYFKLRRKGETRARVYATTAVFVVTWALHSYQSFWLRHTFEFSWPDTIFWAVLGGLVILETWQETQRRRSLVVAGWRMWLRQACSVVTTMCFIIIIWSLWSSPSVWAWLDMIQWWRPAA